MATKKPAPKKAAKPAPKKAVAKPVAKKPAPKKAATKPAPKKALAKPVAKKAVAKPAAKPVAKKPAAKPASKAVAKKPVTKPAAKPVAKKPVTKPAPKAVAKKPVTKPAAKPGSKKPVAKPAEKKAAPKPAPKAVAKPVSKPEPKVVAKPTTSKPIAKPAEKKVLKSFGTLPSNAPKKSDIYKTDTFGASNLKNDSGKVIAHRKTSELKRKSDELNTIKKYEPETTRSILDMSSTQTGPSFRYSDDDLQDFKELILKKLEVAKAELHYLQGVIMRKDEGGTEDTENKYQNMEDGSASMEREQFNQLAGRQITFIQHLEQALVRIENKTYGICRVTGKLIDKARLRAVPHATLSIEAKNAK